MSLHLAAAVLGQQSQAPFNPQTDIIWHSLFWAEGSDFEALGLADGAAVSTWPNETAEQNATQGVSANQPTFDAAHASFNNQPVIDFTPGASGQFLATASFTSAPSYTSGVSVVVISKLDLTTNERYFVDNTTSSQHILRCIGGKWGVFAGATLSEGTGTANTNAHLHVAFFDGGAASTEELMVDGTTVVGPGAGGSNRLVGVTLGASYNNFSSTRLDGQSALVGIYEGDFTADAKYVDFCTWAETHYGLTIA